MAQANFITTLFVDIGGVFLTNGWDHSMRALAAQIFNLDLKELEKRHHVTFNTFEIGHLSLNEYLNRVIFYEKRPFTTDQFQKFMFAQSRELNGMIELITKVKENHQLKVAVVSNEGRELNEFRIKKFKLGKFVDFYVSSCYVHLLKPDYAIYKMALDLTQTEPEQVVYIDDRSLLIQVAEKMGIRGICHTDCQSTRSQLASLGLHDK